MRKSKLFRNVDNTRLWHLLRVVLGLRLEAILRVACSHLLPQSASRVCINFVLFEVWWLLATLFLLEVRRIEAFDIVEIKTHLLKRCVLLRQSQTVVEGLHILVVVCGQRGRAWFEGWTVCVDFASLLLRLTWR